MAILEEALIRRMVSCAMMNKVDLKDQGITTSDHRLLRLGGIVDQASRGRSDLSSDQAILVMPGTDMGA